MVLFLPLILDVLESACDVQVNVCTHNGSISAQVLGHEAAASIPMSCFTDIKEHVLAWEPRRISKQESFANLLARRQ